MQRLSPQTTDDLAAWIERIAPASIMQSRLGAAMKVCWLALWHMAECQRNMIDTTLAGLAAAVGRAKASEADSALRGLEAQGLVKVLRLGSGRVSVEVFDPGDWRLIEAEPDDPQLALDLPAGDVDPAPVDVESAPVRIPRDRASWLLGVIESVRKAIATQDGFEAWHPVAYALLVDAGVLSQDELLSALGSGPAKKAKGMLSRTPGVYSRGSVAKTLAARTALCEAAGLPLWPNGEHQLWDKRQMAAKLSAAGIDVNQHPEWGIRAG